MMNTNKYQNLYEKYGSQQAVADHLNIPRETVRNRMRAEKAKNRIDTNRKNVRKIVVDNVVTKDINGVTAVRRFILTSAVSGANVHKSFLSNLKAYAKQIKAELHIGPLGDKFVEDDPFIEEDFDKSFLKFVSETPFSVEDKIRYCPELNLKATMVTPLSSLQAYTKSQWSVFPHTKIEMNAVPTGRNAVTKLMVTTGTITHPNYSNTKAGYRAHFDHCYGALLVEVSKKGVWFRHLRPKDDKNGAFYDLDKYVSTGKVRKSKGVEALVYGDIHVEKIDATVARKTWGIDPEREMKVKNACPKTSVAGILKPKCQVFHDLLDMTAANHHDAGNILVRYARWAKVQDSIMSDIDQGIDFLSDVQAFSKDNVVIPSNHDDFISRWLLSNPERIEDFENLELYYKMKLHMINKVIEKTEYSVLGEVVAALGDKNAKKVCKNIEFLVEDDSYVIKGVECGWHGHRGANGARGSSRSFKHAAIKSFIGHSHTPRIESGCYTVGTSSKLFLGYNKGPSSWAHTHGVIYPDGNRTLITMSDGRFWAGQ